MNFAWQKSNADGENARPLNSDNVASVSRISSNYQLPTSNSLLEIRQAPTKREHLREDICHMKSNEHHQRAQYHENNLNRRKITYSGGMQKLKLRKEVKAV